MNHLSPRWSALLVPLCTALVFGCMNRELVRVDPKTESYITEDVPVQDFVGVDVLVVVDNSGSMAAEQALLSSAFPSLISSILNPPNDPATGQRVHAPVRDLHIGVVNTDMGVGGYTGIETCGKDDPDYNPMIGDNGVLRNTPRGTSCDPNYPSFLSYSIEPTAEPNLTQVDKLSRDFGCIAVLGTGGCGFEQQLEAARKAIMPPPEGHSGPGGANAGFIRDNTILTILFVSDEEDCSAQDPTVFDVAELPYSINLQCFYQEPKLHKVDRYLQAFGTVRPDLKDFVVGFIVGVPVNEPKCNGRGSALGACLTGVPLMQQVVQPDGDLLEFSCKYPADCTPPDPNSHQPGNCRSEAFPARRYVEIAQMMGDNAIVQSICQEDFLGAVAALTEKLKEAIKEKEFRRRLELEKDPANACRCLASCNFIEVLGTSEPCPAGKTPYDEDGDTVADVQIDDAGQAHTLCEIPQAGIVIKGYKSDPGCSAPASLCDAACDDPCVTFEADGAVNGWWYDPTTRKVDFSKVPPKQGSGVNIQCRSVVCSESRQCGATGNLNAKCCNVNEYCYYPGGNKNAPGYCLVRKDVCEEYGDDVWCPAVGPVASDPNIGGLCCLDHDMDGNLSRALEDVNGDTIGEVPGAPLYACNPGTGCVLR